MTKYTHLDNIDRLVKVVNGSVLKSAEASIDATDEFVHLVSQLLVARCVFLRRRCDLHEHYAVCPRRIGVQKFLKGDEFVGDTLDVIHSIDAED